MGNIPITDVFSFLLPTNKQRIILVFGWVCVCSCSIRSLLSVACENPASHSCIERNVIRVIRGLRIEENR
ncbi:hypothetical protein E2C01_094876 [Portunus trituberculatus]|uniref:Uncharacterized protein n=1 Tax=Portunus trituberculatus TaxID=210409 RepID=A0A5B7JTN2_PORTR|nr:hypothetical protein [Portunus trituberculatus]